jgi:nucleotide-binding universal stress UspA family protein
MIQNCHCRPRKRRIAVPYRIMVALDGSSRAERAIPVTEAFARALHAEVELMQVIDPCQDADGTGAVASAAMVAAKTRLAHDYLMGVGRRLRGAVPMVKTYQGSPAAETIVLQARKRQADLIVMASHGHAGLLGALIDSVARDVVRASTVPVLLLRERTALPTSVQALKVLAPIDVDDLDSASLGPLLRLAEPLGWRLFLCWIANLAEDVLSGPTAGTPEHRIRGVYPERVAALERRAERIRASGLGVTVRLECGAVGPRIIQLAHELDADLIAMSTHGRQGLGRLVLGSVTEYVIEHADVPVFTVCPTAIARGQLSHAR